MTTQIRRSVFETNSSSSHSLTLGPEGMRDMSMMAAALKKGEITVKIDDHFGWEWKRYYRPENKIAYLLSQFCAEELMGLRGDGRDMERLKRRNHEADMILTAVEEATGCPVTVKVNTDYVGVDHESSGVGRDVLAGKDRLLDFLFSPEAYIETGNDNSKAPARMETDLGRLDETYADHFTEKSPRGLKVEIGLAMYSSTCSAFINRENLELNAAAKFFALRHISDHIKGFTANKAIVTLYKPRVFNTVRIVNGQMSNGSEDWRSGEILREKAMNAVHHLLDVANCGTDFRITRDIDIAIRVEQADGTSYSTPEPTIRFIGVMNAANIELLKAGFQEMNELERERQKSAGETPDLS